MTLQEYRRLQAERGALDRLLDELPGDRVIERQGLESRRREIERALAVEPAPNREPVHARLTFRGKPIVGSHGIFAEFGAAAVEAFSEAVAAIGASAGRSLGARGMLPDRDAFRLLITGTAPGSFGFLLEEAAQANLSLFPDTSPLQSAIDRTLAIMRATLGTDDELTEALSEADPRALEALRRFLEQTAQHEAVCALEVDGEAFRFDDVEQVRRSSKRLEQDNVHESEESLQGRLLGVLPEHRRFEFRVDPTQEVIDGSVGPEIEDAGAINESLDRPVTVVVRSRRVGQGRPRYTLLRYAPSDRREDDGSAEQSAD